MGMVVMSKRELTAKDIELTGELPGMEQKDVEASVAGNLLTIKGEKKSEKGRKDLDYRVFAHSYGSVSRCIELPTGVDQISVRATLSNGVLKVGEPMLAPVQAKKGGGQGHTVSIFEKRVPCSWYGTSLVRSQPALYGNMLVPALDGLKRF
jgi:Hsp20/alpha crystallin family protein